MRKTEIRVEPAEAFFVRGRKTAVLAQEGRRIPGSRIVSFEDVQDLLALLTRQRVRLLESLREAPGSIAGLARELKRERSAVTRDVKMLQQHGVVVVTEKPLPGHGRQKWVRAAAKEIQLTARL